MWYNKRPHPVFKKYFDNTITDYNLKDIKERMIFAAKCLGYLDCLFNKAKKLDKRFPVKDYMFLRNKILAMAPKELNLH